MLEAARTWLSWKMAPASVKALANSDGGMLMGMLGNSSSGFSGHAKGTPELLDAYNRMPWLRAVVHKVSYSVGMTTWRLFVAKSRSDNKTLRVQKFQYGPQDVRHRLIKQARDEIKLDEITDHPLLTLLNAGNSSFLPGTTNQRMVQMYYDLVGEAFQLKERGPLRNPTTKRGVITGLVTIPPHWVRRFPTGDDPTYGIQMGRSGEVEDIPVEDVIFYRDVNPLDPFGRGSGHAKSLGDELQANEAASRTIRTRLENNAIPPFVAMPEQDTAAPMPDQIERIREDWQKRLRGPNKAGFVHFLRTRFKFEKLAGTFEELQLIPLLQHQRDTIIQVYGVPPEIFGILNSSNRATIEASEFLFGKFVLLPRLEFNRAVLQQVLVPEFDDRLILDFESPISEDEARQLAVMRSVPWAFKANDIRRRAGEPSLGPKGEVFAVPENVSLRTSLVDSEARVDPPKDDNEDEDDEEGSEDEDEPQDDDEDAENEDEDKQGKQAG